MKTRSLIAALLIISACGSTPSAPDSARKDPIKGESFLKDGPSIALDDTARMSDPTTLQLLSERTEELEKLKKRLTEVENESAARAEELARTKSDLEATRREKERVEGLLTAASEKERAALERGLAAEAARLRMEQELLRARLGDLMKDR